MKYLILATALLCSYSNQVFAKVISVCTNVSVTDTSKMLFRIHTSSQNVIDFNNIFIDLEFKNVSDTTIRFMDFFSYSEKSLGTFLSIEITTSDKKIIYPLRGGKISFNSEPQFQYINIPIDQSYSKPINVAEILIKKNIFLSQGTYKLKMSLHNEYGDNCIKGWFDSNELEFRLKNNKN